ncbi:ABC transporter permease subunit [bacterium 1XD42-1]|nr:ABC transporter permease subunit [Oscillospiraceae bacterium]RKJ57120.1 ABC transporter permease subunit [bacterium 1XD42-8]RKJ66246.1 ABC transporter permease subunit [bacterium 1XD42-1]
MDKVISFFKKYWITIFIYIGLVVLYKIIADNKLVDAFLFPPVDSIIEAFQENKGLMLTNMLYSFQLMIPSIIIAVAIALTVGTVLGMNQRIREVLHPVIYTISVVPSILLSPFALLLAPNFRSASLFLVVYGTIWSTLFATITGIQTIDKRYLDNAATLELRGLQKFFRVILPAASPSILGGFVNSLRGSFVILVYAEMYGAKYGMGFFVKKYSEYGLYSETWCGFIFMVAVLVIVMQIFERVKSHLLKWTIN